MNVSLSPPVYRFVKMINTVSGKSQQFKRFSSIISVACNIFDALLGKINSNRQLRRFTSFSPDYQFILCQVFSKKGSVFKTSSPGTSYKRFFNVELLLNISLNSMLKIGHKNFAKNFLSATIQPPELFTFKCSLILCIILIFV